jgi:isopentenyl phosphate kinase
METYAIATALEHRLVPLVYGDVAMDTVRGGTIISTEEIFAWLARRIVPDRIVLAGVVPGVLQRGWQHAVGEHTELDSSHVIRRITPRTAASVLPVLGQSHGTDVTGGMLAKVRVMCELVETMPSVKVKIVSGEECGLLTRILSDSRCPAGTSIQSDDPEA